MASVHDVAAAVLSEYGRPVSAMKLEKLVYYSQAWHLVWTGRALFDSEIQAWAKGPVCPELYRHHRGRYEINDWPLGDVTKLTAGELTTVAAVVRAYGPRSAQWLSELTHSEQPWLGARGSVPAGAPSRAEIPHAEMQDFYAKVSR